MTRDSADDNQHLPPWLRGVPLPPRPAASSTPFAAPTPGSWPETPAAAESDEMPDWLKDLSAEAGLEPSSAAPGMSAWPGDEAGSTSDTSSDSALPSWLGQVSSEQSQAPDRDASTADSALPDWLRGAAGELPAETPAPSESFPGQQAAESSDQMPSWLSGLAAGEPAASTFEQPAPDSMAADTDKADESLPDWLQGRSGADAGASGSPDTNAALWIDTGPPSGAPSEPGSPAPDTAKTDDSGVPSWLRDISDDEIRRVMEGDEEIDEGISVEPFAFGESSGTPSSASSTNSMPAWLSGAAEGVSSERDSEPSWLGSLTDEPRQPAAGGERDSEPSWLGSLTDEPTQSDTASQPDVPLWLQDLDTSPTSESQAIVPEQFSVEESAATPPTESTENIPAWLRETEQIPASTDAIPAWLQEETAKAAPAEELPAWLNAEAPPERPAEIPSWLNADISAPPASSGPPPPAEDLPPWLSDAITSAPPPTALPPAEPKVSPQAPAAPPSGSADELPAWLRAETPTPAEEELPNWLQSAPQSAPQPAQGVETPAPVAEELPDWLQSNPQPAASAPDTGAQSAVLPDWLQASPPTTPPPTAPTARPADDLPPWLRDDAGQPLPTAGAPGDANLPEWLRGEAASGPATPADSAPPVAPNWLSAEPPVAPPAPSAPPSLDWFGDDQRTSSAGRASAGESEFFGGAELPAWLRKADTEPTAEISPADARSLDWLTKLGAHEEESAAVATTPTVKLPLPQAPARSDAQLNSLVLLRRLAAQPYPDVFPAPSPAEGGIWQRIGLDRALYVLLLIALLAALAVPSLGAGLQAPPEDPAAAALFQRIDTLTDKDVVLIGYEWDARRIGELKPLERAVIGHLIQKRVKLILISTDPQGTLLLFDLRELLIEANYRPATGEDYILLGYKPGGELALRLLAQDFRGVLGSDFQGNDATVSGVVSGFETGKPINTLNDLAMILVLADDASDVQSWAEQIYGPDKQRPLAFLLPAEAAPIVQPYLQPPRTPGDVQIGHLAGKYGALAYEQLRGPGQTSTVQVARETGEQRLGILVFVILLLVGGIAVVASGRLRRGASA